MGSDGDNSYGVRAVGQGLSAAIGLGIGGPAGAVIGAAVSDAVVELTGRAWDEITAARRQSAAAVVQLAADDLNEDPARLLRRALSHAESAALLADALAAAAHTFSVRKVAALAKAVANGLGEDRARIDEEWLVVRALAGVDEPHLKVLLAFNAAPRGWYTSRNISYIQQALPGASEETARHVVATLEGAGLISDDVQGRMRRELTMERKGALDRIPANSRQDATRYEEWVVTGFGRACIRHFDNVKEDEVAGRGNGF